MTNEIKENLSEMLFNRDERLLDYITNLQEENERLKEVNKHLKWERDSYYEDIICYIRNTMHVKDKKARKTFDKVSMDWSSSTIYLTLCELDKDLRGDE